MDIKVYKIEIFVPEEYVVKLRDELNKIGALKVGLYDNVMSYSRTKGFWRPLDGSAPFEGEVGNINSGEECKVEIRCPAETVKEALKVIRKVHPYEEPLINVLPVMNSFFE